MTKYTYRKVYFGHNPPLVSLGLNTLFCIKYPFRFSLQNNYTSKLTNGKFFILSFCRLSERLRKLPQEVCCKI